jgi:hypothetical protein
MESVTFTEREEEIDFGEEASLPHGDVVLVIARGVGALVAIAALLVLVLFMSVLRAGVGYLLRSIGLVGVVSCLGLFTWGALKLAHLPSKMLRILLTRSCN